MPLRKIAITVPQELLLAVDRVAEASHESRNRFVTRVLEEAVRARRDSEITARLDALFAQPDLTEEQRQTAAALDEVGTSWTDERW